MLTLYDSLRPHFCPVHHTINILLKNSGLWIVLDFHVNFCIVSKQLYWNVIWKQEHIWKNTHSGLYSTLWTKSRNRSSPTVGVGFVRVFLTRWHKEAISCRQTVVDRDFAVHPLAINYAASASVVTERRRETACGVQTGPIKLKKTQRFVYLKLRIAWERHKIVGKFAQCFE